jgi:hypothetical protein
MSGVLAMGANKITGVANPTAAQDVATKGYTDTLFGSTSAAATSASNAATSNTNSGNSATASANSATAAANSATAAANSATAGANSATAAANSASAAGNKLPKSGGAMTGAITTNSTFDGRDVATDGALLDAVATTYDPIGASVAMAIALGG